MDVSISARLRLVDTSPDTVSRFTSHMHLNEHLQSYAKVFRTYNASITFQSQLDEGTPEVGTLQEKLNHYNLANRMFAILCNHQCAAPKSHDQSMTEIKKVSMDGHTSMDGPCSNLVGYSSVGPSTI